MSLAVAIGCDLLSAAGSDTPRLDAELLLGEVMGVDRARLVIERRELLAASDWEGFEALLARRAAHEPVAYILGRRAFRRLVLQVDARVLIPRPETELLVEVGLHLGEGVSVLDVGTGSGAVALALQDERPDLDVRGVDVSPDAIDVARANALHLGLSVAFTVADLLEGIHAVDAVLANLPYVSDGERLPADVADFEPQGALFAGADGLAVVRRLVAALGGLASLPGLLALEISPSQADEVAALVRGAGYATVNVEQDLAGRERVVVGQGPAGGGRVVVARP